MSNIGIKITADTSGLKRGLDDAASQVQQFGTKSSQSLSGLGAGAGGAQAAVAGLSNGLVTAFVGGSVAVGIINLVNRVGELKAALIETQIQSDKMRNGLNFAVGAGNSVREIEFLRTNARDLGLELVTTTEQYTKLAAAARGTSLEGQGARDVFTSLAKASTVMGLSAQETQGALLAVTQMISKGKVQAEELRGQLGERLPGAFQIAARAMGVTTAELDKMLETGQVLAEDFLPKFAAQLSREVAPQVDEASKSMQASVNRMTNASTELKRAFNELGAGDVFKTLNDNNANFYEAITEKMRETREEGGGTFKQLVSAADTFIGRLFLMQNFDLNLKTHPERLQGLNEDLADTEKQLLEFQGKAAADPSNLFLARGIEQLKETISFLKQARGEQMALIGGQGGNNAEDARFARSAQKVAAENTANERMRKDLAGVRAKLSPGLDADYLKNLNILQSAREAGEEKGGLSEKAYIGLVSDLAKKNYTGPKVERRADSDLNSMQGQIKIARERIAVADEQADSMDKLTAGEKRYQELQADSTKGFSKAALAAREEALALFKLSGEKERVNAQREADAAALQAYGRASDDQLGKLREEAAVYDLTGVALQKITTARALDKAAQSAIYETKIDADGVEQKRLKVTEAVAEKIRDRTEADKAATAVLIEQVAAQKLIIQNDEEIAKLKANGTVYLDASTKALAMLDLERIKRRKNLDAYKEDSAERRRLVAQDTELYQAGLDNIRADKLREVWQSVDQTAHQTFVNIFEGGQDAFTKLRDTLKSTLLDLLYQMTVRKWVFDITAAVTGSGGITNGVQQGLMGGSSNLLSSGASLYNSYGKIALGAVGGWLGFGGVSAGAGSAAVGSTFTGAASNGAFAAANGGLGASSAGFAGIPVVGWIAMGMIASGEAYDKGFSYGKKGGVGYTVSDGGLIGPNGMLGGINKMLQGLGIDPKTAAILSGSALGAQAMYTVLGGYNVSNVGGGLSGTLSASGSSLQKRTDYTQDHRGFLGIGSYTTHNSEYSAADTSVSNYVDKAIGVVVASVKTFAGALGLSADKIDGYTSTIDISLDGLKPEEQQAAIDKALTGFMDGLVTSAFGTAVTGLSLAGETASQTLMRLGVDLGTIRVGMGALGVDTKNISIETINALHGTVTELITVDTVFSQLKYTLFDVSAAGGAAAKGLVDAFGGLQNFVTQTSETYRNFYTRDEQKAATVKSIYTDLTAAGITTSEADIAGADRATWRQVLDAFGKDTGTAEGAKKYAAVTVAANRINQYLDTSQAAPKVEPSAAAPKVEPSAATPKVEPVYDKALNAWELATQAIVKTMSDLRTTLVESGPDSFAKLQAQFAIEAASAEAGNLSAAQDLPALAKSLAGANKAWATSSVQRDVFNARIIETLARVAGTSGAGANLSIPKFAAGGYHTGGWALVGEQGPELVNMPSARVFNARDTRSMLGGNTDPAVLEELRALRAELAAIRAATGATAVNTGKAAKVLDAATKGGQPLATTAV